MMPRTKSKRRNSKSKSKTSRVKVYSYVRFSTPEQRKGRGAARQTESAQRWCEKHGYVLEPANAFADLGTSAFKGRHRGPSSDLSRFLRLVDDGAIRPGSILLIESLDRLSREAINEAVALLLQIVNRGIVVVTLIDGAVYRGDSNPQQLMVSLIMSVAIFMRANDESRHKSERKADSWKSKREGAEKGVYHGGKLPSWLEWTGKAYRVIEAEAAKVREVFDDYVAGLGLYRLSAKHDIPRATVGYWLDSTIVLGTLTVHDGGTAIDIPDHYPTIINRKVWERAQSRRASRYIERRPANGKYINLFTGILRDPKGKPMIIGQHNGGTVNYFSVGYVVRARYVEEVVCADRLLTRFVTTREVEETRPQDEKQLKKIEQNMAHIAATIREEPLLAMQLTPALRELKAKKRKIVGEPKVVREAVDVRTVTDLLNDEQDQESRIRMREIAQQTIKEIKLTEVQSENWFQMISGTVTLTDDSKVTFRFAHNTRRVGWIVCDRRPDPALAHLPGPKPVFATRLTPEVKAQLQKLPTRRELAELEQQWKQAA